MHLHEFCVFAIAAFRARQFSEVDEQFVPGEHDDGWSPSFSMKVRWANAIIKFNEIWSTWFIGLLPIVLQKRFLSRHFPRKSIFDIRLGMQITVDILQLDPLLLIHFQHFTGCRSNAFVISCRESFYRSFLQASVILIKNYCKSSFMPNELTDP